MNSITTDNTGIYTNGYDSITGGNIYINTPIQGYSNISTDIHYDTNYEFAEFTELTEKLNSLLSISYKEIVDNYVCFLVHVDGKVVKPIDDILIMINKKTSFNLKIGRYGYEIFINNIRFTKIKNLIESSAKEYIKVEFEYDSIEYNNTLKSELDKRTEKMDLLKHKIKNK